MIDRALYDEARDRIAAAGFTPGIQSKISLVLGAAKSGNLLFQSQVQWRPGLGVVQQFFISQAAREFEALTLLARTTRWSPDGTLLLGALRIVAPLMNAWGKVMGIPGPFLDRAIFYRGISLGHAQLARIRLAPILPDNVDALAPFAMALQRIEQENGRMLQTQIRLLKNIGTELPLEARETLIEQDQEMVDGVFNEFLAWISTP